MDKNEKSLVHNVAGSATAIITEDKRDSYSILIRSKSMVNTRKAAKAKGVDVEQDYNAAIGKRPAKPMARPAPQRPTPMMHGLYLTLRDAHTRAGDARRYTWGDINQDWST